MYITHWFEKALEQPRVKRLCVSLIIGLAVTGYAAQYAAHVQADIARQVVRLHVLANSDSAEDQRLKLLVRDGVISYLKPLLAGAQTVDDTKDILRRELRNIEAVAAGVLAENGSGDEVYAELGNFEFPVKYYEGARFPAGYYDALRICIGDAEGRNWWCVLYPQLCFSPGNGTLPDESKTQLKNVLNEDEFDLVTSQQRTVQFKFKFLDWISSIF